MQLYKMVSRTIEKYNLEVIVEKNDALSAIKNII